MAIRSLPDVLVVQKYGPSIDLEVTFTVQMGAGAVFVQADVKDGNQQFTAVPIQGILQSHLLQSVQKVAALLRSSIVDFINQKVSVFLDDPLSTYLCWKKELQETEDPQKIASLKYKISYLEADKTIEELQSASSFSLELNRKYILLGDKYLNLRCYPEANACYQKSCQNIYVFKNNLSIIVRSHGSLGISYKEVGDIKRSLHFHKICFLAASLLGDEWMVAKARFNMGSSLMGLEKAEQALAHFQEHCHYVEKHNNLGEIWISHQNIGTALDSLGKSGEAVVEYEKALQGASEPFDRGGLYINLGEIYNKMGLYKEALEAYDSAEIFYKQAELELSDIFAGRANVYSHLGEYERALEYHLRALEAYKRQGNLTKQAVTLSNLGTVYSFLGELQDRHASSLNEESDQSANPSYWDLEIEACESSLAIAKEIGNLTCKCTVEIHLAESYFRASNFDRCLHFFINAFNTEKHIEDPSVQLGFSSLLGRISMSIGKFDEAKQCFKEGLALAISMKSSFSEGSLYYDLGNLKMKKGKFKKAAQYFKQSIAILSKMQEENTAIDIQKGISFFEIIFYPYRLLEKVLLLELKAERYEPEAVGESSSISLHERAIRRSPGLINALGEGNLSSRGKEPVVSSSQQEAFEEILRVSDSSRATALVNFLKKKIGVAGVESASFPEIIDMLKRWKTILLMYSCDPTDMNRGWCWVVDAEGKITHKELDLAPIWEEMKNVSGRPSYIQGITLREEEKELFRGASQISDYLDWLIQETDSLRGEGSESGRRKQTAFSLWYQALISPIKHLLPNQIGSRLTIVSDSMIHQLPFEAFKDPGGKYLIDQFAIQTAPSIETLLSIEKLERKNKGSRQLDKVCIVANPSGEKKLDGAQREGRIAKDFFSNPVLLEADEATKAGFLRNAPSAGYIHLACHGSHIDLQGVPTRRDKHSVFQGSLALTDERLFAEDIAEISLNADLAILSACESGKGNILKEGVAGLSHAFLAAGASTVIATRWKIPDEEAQIIIQKFYELYFQGNKSSEQEANHFEKAEALRSAILACKEKYSHRVQAWGGFFLVGLPG